MVNLLLAQSAVRLFVREEFVVDNLAQQLTTTFHCRKMAGTQPISPETPRFGVYFPTSKKNLIALFWTAVIAEKVLCPQTAAP